MCSFILSRLDYCNSLLIRVNCDQMYRLQKVPNHGAKVDFPKVDMSTRVSLAVKQRKEYFQDGHLFFQFNGWRRTCHLVSQCTLIKKNSFL